LIITEHQVERIKLTLVNSSMYLPGFAFIEFFFVLAGLIGCQHRWPHSNSIGCKFGVHFSGTTIQAYAKKRFLRMSSNKDIRTAVKTVRYW